MDRSDIEKLVARIETTTRRFCGENPSPQELYDAREMLCIQILDSEYMDYPEGELESILMDHLEKMRP
jgi:hypothetical protein